VFTAPLTLEEYRVLVDVKYRPDAATAAGWALADKDGRIHGWHPRQPGSPHWARHDDAFRAFVPDRKRRHHLALLGHTVRATTGVDELVTLLRHERGEAEHHRTPPPDTAPP